MSDLYSFWRARLAGDTSPAVLNDPQAGFYRVRMHKGGEYMALAVFPLMGITVGWLGARDNGRQIRGDDLNDRWVWANRDAITEKVYRLVAEEGQPWPDADPLASKGIGHNSNAVSDEEQIKSQINAASAGVKDYETITDADHLSRSQTLRSRILELSREADGKRKELKKPHQDKADAVDDDWMPIIKGAKVAADKINAAQSAYTTKLLREREAAEAKIAADKAALEAKGVRLPDLAPPPPLPTKVKGASGRAASLGSRTVVKAVTDWHALAANYIADPSIQAALLKLANKALENGAMSVPGVETETVGRVK